MKKYEKNGVPLPKLWLTLREREKRNEVNFDLSPFYFALSLYGFIITVLFGEILAAF